MIVGRFVPGVFKALPSEQFLTPQALSIPHQVYEVRVRTVPMSAMKIREVVWNLACVQVADMDIIAVEAEEDRVRIQVTGSPFLWAPFLAILPQLIGPIVALIIGLVLVVKIPDWAWAAIPLGIGGGFLLYAISEAKRGNRR